ncbi:uncharacterized protein LOC108102280 [Drosophila ficusphila]|uniref:uncharacterized protein LOC108102280 n=1 Tax=Drosophila ficusphila TaxID=30025 RepID=UPI0007E6BFDF|nr:uncharacterized protein LOC108102280 [Drosophila ficusphila]
MFELRGLIVILSLFLFSGDVQGDCQLRLADTWTDRIFAYYGKNGYELLLTDRLGTYQQISLLCGGNEAVFTTTCQWNGRLYPDLPKKNCTVAIPASVETSRDSTCGATMYHVGFWFKKTFLELYRNCYDGATMTAYFSIAKVYPTYLSSIRPPTAFDRDGIISPADEATFQQKNIYNRFETLLGPKQNYILSANSLSFDRGHLTPVADFTFPTVMRATNKYLNVVPQYYSFNRGNWKTVEAWVRDQHQIQNVCTGALGVLELNNKQNLRTPIYLAPKKNPVPRWLYKIVHNFSTKRKTVIVTSNNGWDTNPFSFCRVVTCPPSLHASGTGFTFCCDPNHFINTYVPNLANVC